MCLGWIQCYQVDDKHVFHTGYRVGLIAPKNQTHIGDLITVLVHLVISCLGVEVKESLTIHSSSNSNPLKCFLKIRL